MEATVQVCIDRIATATPPHDVHEAFLEFASGSLKDPRKQSLLKQMAQRSGIGHRYSFVQPLRDVKLGSVDGLFRPGHFPSTAKRMELFEQFAPLVLRCALDRLALSADERSSIGHVILTCCTGLFAPGLDFTAIDHLGLDPNIERTFVGFMGCYAAVNGLKLARHIVRSEPASAVLLINLELCTLHFQETQDLAKLLSFLLFGDGCAVSLIRAGDRGFAIDSFRAFAIPEARDLIQWKIGDQGFDMDLSGQVPGELRKALRRHADDLDPNKDTGVWAVHPGGRSVLDAAEAGLELAPEALAASRSVLHRFGNMSSATIMFVLQDLITTAQPGQRGCAMAFGPGLAAETMRFHVL